MADLTAKTLAELNSEFAVLGNQLSVLVQSRREYELEINKRMNSVAAKVRLDLLSNSEKDALRAALGEPLQSRGSR